MTRRTRPKQYLDANNNVLPYEAAQDAIRASLEGGSNVRYYASSRPNASQQSNADYESEVTWRIYRLTYSGNNIVRKDFASGSNDFDHVWDNGANATITNVTQANPGVVTVNSTTWSDGTPIADGDKIEITDVQGMTELNGNYYFVDDWNGGAMTFTLNVGNGVNDESDTDVDTTAFTAYSAAGVANKRSYLNHSYS